MKEAERATKPERRIKVTPVRRENIDMSQLAKVLITLAQDEMKKPPSGLDQDRTGEQS